MATELTRINLTHDFVTNGTTIPAGSHELPKDQADDLMRRQREYDKSRERIMEKSTYMHNSGSMAVGGTE